VLTKNIDKKNQHDKIENKKQDASHKCASGQCDWCRLENLLSEHLKEDNKDDGDPWTPWSNIGKVQGAGIAEAEGLDREGAQELSETGATNGGTGTSFKNE
jgi:hypothetical protein